MTTLGKTASDTLERQIALAMQRYRELTPEQKAEMWAAQRRSWVVGEMLLEHPNMTREYAEALYNKIVDPFGRQPLPVTVIIRGADPDVEYWTRELMRKGEFKGDMVQKNPDGSFTIYPRAVND